MNERRKLILSLSRMTIMLLVVTIFSLFYVACSTNPTEADGRKALEDHWKYYIGSMIDIISYKKTNGVAREIFGVKVYEMDYEVKIKYMGDIIDIKNGKINFEKTEKGWKAIQVSDGGRIRLPQ